MIKEMMGRPLRNFNKFFLVTIEVKYKCFCVNFVKMDELIVREIQVPLGGLRDRREKQKTTDLAIKLATNLQHDCKISCKCFKDVDKYWKYVSWLNESR